MRRVLSLVGVAVALAACQVPEVALAPAPNRADVIDGASSCGQALGFAARCNLMRDDTDFAVARYDIVSGYRQSLDPALARDAETALDMAVLTTMREVRSCRLDAAGAGEVTRQIHQRLQACQMP
jgi:hypothetical protein